MRYMIALAAFGVLGACGVDGAPVRPEKDSAQAPAPNASAQPDPDDWISGTVSMHTAATL